MRVHLFDEDRHLRPHVLCFIDGVSSRLDQPDQPVADEPRWERAALRDAPMVEASEARLEVGQRVMPVDATPVADLTATDATAPARQSLEHDAAPAADVGRGAAAGSPLPQRKRARVIQHAAKTVMNRRCRGGSDKMLQNCCAKR